MFSSAPKTIVRSLSRAAHFSIVCTFGSTMPSKTVRPFATTLIGRRKSKIDGDSSSVNALTPSVDASTTFPRRTRSTRPDGLRRGKIGVGGRSTSTGENTPSSVVTLAATLDDEPHALALDPLLHDLHHVEPVLHGLAVDLHESIAGAQADLKCIRPGHDLLRTAAAIDRRS